MLLQAKAILLAREIIAINQDPLGIAGDLIWKQGPNEVRVCAARGTAEGLKPSISIMP